MFKIDEHIGVATSGLVADARQLVARAVLNHKLTESLTPILFLSTFLSRNSAISSNHSRNTAVPVHLVLHLIGGVDDEGIHLYETDPSGAYQSYHAGAIGSNRNTVIEYFEKNWKSGMTLNAAMKMGLEALRSANDAELNRDAVEVVVVDGNGYRILDRGEVNKQLDRLKPLED